MDGMRAVNFHTLGQAHTLSLLASRSLDSVTGLLQTVFHKPRHQLKLVSDNTGQIFQRPYEQPFLPLTATDFTVIFVWEDMRENGLGRLPALTDYPANGEEWPLQSADAVHSGGAYFHPATRETWTPCLGMNLRETLLCLRRETIRERQGASRGYTQWAIVVSRANTYHASKLTIPQAHRLLGIVEDARKMHLSPTLRLYVESLAVYLVGVGLQPRRCRYVRKSAERAPLSMQVRLRNFKAMLAEID